MVSLAGIATAPVPKCTAATSSRSVKVVGSSQRMWSGAAIRQRRVPRFVVRADNQGVEQQPPSGETQASKQEEEPIWVKREKARELTQKTSGELPFGVYLLGSVIVAIASIGSLFELANKNPLFGVVQPDSPLWAPILGLFALTGLPTSGFLFYKAVSAANKLSEEMDKMDGY